jgi:hypothetical protein
MLSRRCALQFEKSPSSPEHGFYASNTICLAFAIEVYSPFEVCFLKLAVATSGQFFPNSEREKLTTQAF